MQIALSPAASEAEFSDPALCGDWVSELPKMLGGSQTPPWCSYVARSEGRAVGVGGFKGLPDAQGYVEIAYLTLIPERGLGVAKAVAERLVGIAREAGVSGVLAHTLPEVNGSTGVLAANSFGCVGIVEDPEDGIIWPWVRPFSAGQVVLRPATLDDVPLLQRWDREPHVIACTSDDPEAEAARDIDDWSAEIAAAMPVSFHLIAEANGEPIGAMQICDPHLEPTHYWDEIEPGLRAIDIWIGRRDRLGQGLGTQMMTKALDLCFSDPDVTAVVIDPLTSNTAAHRFYRRVGFEPIGRRTFDEDDCLVHRLQRETWSRKLDEIQRQQQTQSREHLPDVRGPAKMRAAADYFDRCLND